MKKFTMGVGAGGAKDPKKAEVPPKKTTPSKPSK